MKTTTQNQINAFCHKFGDLAFLKEELEKAVTESVKRIRAGGKVLICGNGGSAADSEHIVGELLKSFYIPRPVSDRYREKLNAVYGREGDFIADNLQGGIPAISLVSQTGFLTAFGNDVDSNMAYAQQVHAYATEGDIFIGITTSGNAKNVGYAAMVAKERGCLTIGMTGSTGGKLKEHSQILFNVPETETYKVQELHLPVYHLYCMCVENEIFGE